MTYGIGMYGSMPQTSNVYAHNHKGAVLQNLQNRYGCTDCFETGPYFVQYPIRVLKEPVRNDIPTSFWGKLFNSIFGR